MTNQHTNGTTNTFIMLVRRHTFMDGIMETPLPPN